MNATERACWQQAHTQYPVAVAEAGIYGQAYFGWHTQPGQPTPEEVWRSVVREAFAVHGLPDPLAGEKTSPV